MSSENMLFLVDVMPLLYRGHFAFMKSPRMTSTGINTSALFGFASSLVQMLNDYHPTHIALAMDPDGKTFRHEAFAPYKAQREKAPEDIVASIAYAATLAEALNIPMIRVAGYEADDVMGTLAARAAAAGWTTYLATPDKDVAQLVGPSTMLYRPGHGATPAEIYDVAKVCEHWKIASPAHMVDYLGLAGDASDNIPGITGVGEKTAVSLLAQFGDIEGIIAHASEIKGKLSDKVIAGADAARTSKWLATIRTDVPVDITLDALARKPVDMAKLQALLTQFEMPTIGRRLLGDAYVATESNASSDEVAYKTLVDVSHTYSCVTTDEQVDALIRALNAAERWAFDTETTGLNPRVDRLVGMSFATAPGVAWWVPVPSEYEACVKLLSRFAPCFANCAQTKIAHNAKFDRMILERYGIVFGGDVHDTMLAHYVLDASERHGMDHLARHYLHYNPIPISALIGDKKKGETQLNMGDLSPESITDYAAEDADVTLQLDTVLRAEVKAIDAERALTTSEEPLVKVLIDMEREGVSIDTAALQAYGMDLDRELLALEISLRDLAGCDFNPSSPKQLGDVLFGHLNLDPKAARTASGQYATGEDVLVRLRERHPIIQKILDYRACSKLKSTYVDKLPTCVDPVTGRVHTTFSQAFTETGRLSSSDPNLQNIPIRTERGQPIRRAFVPRDAQHVMLSADYSQIELRIMAAMSKDPAMLDAFAHGADIHAETAARVYDVMPLFVTPEMRSACKMVNFGIIYGISAFGLGQRLNIPRKQAAELIDTYFRMYPRIKAYMDESIAVAREKGYAETVLGRRRYLRDIASRNATSRQAAERNAINTPIQGTAADIIKLAMVRVAAALKREQLHAHMVLQIHDELLFEVPRAEVAEVTTLVRREMSNVLDLGVPLDVSVGTGENWLSAH